MSDLVFLVIVAILVAAGVGIAVWFKRFARRFRSEGAIADACPNADGELSLELPEGEAVDLYVEYTLRGARMSGGGLNYGMRLKMDIRRPPQLEQAGEYVFGRAQPSGKLAELHSVAAGPVLRSGMEVTRGLLLLHVPAGAHLVAKGRIELVSGECLGLTLFAKRPR